MQRRNSLAVQHGDYLDEQFGGFGEKLSEIAMAISEIAPANADRD